MPRLGTRTAKVLQTLRSIGAQLAPPVLANGLRRLLRPAPEITWSGDYPTWDAARAASTGYDSDEIVRRVRSATLKVLKGEAAYERDSVCFEEREYRWPLLATLTWIAAQKEGRLNVLDFGGSLGSVYLQHKPFLCRLASVHWNIVEQPAFVRAGREACAGELALRFFETINECLAAETPDTLLMSSVLQYMESPYALLSSIVGSFEFAIIEGTPFSEGRSRDLLTVQHIGPSIYPASYPCWFLRRDNVVDLMSASHEIVGEWPDSAQRSFPGHSTLGLLFQRKSQLSMLVPQAGRDHL